MRGYIIIPDSVSCSACKYCGARPIIAPVEIGEYVVKCPNNDSHYQTAPGLIDIDDWNLHNPELVATQTDTTPNGLLDQFFQLNGTIVSLASAD